ncbi:hypothetical protein SFMTTN_0081 [Sulfuriferula multivorans]|uniref:RCK C-terminal domain-containing protein n=2 Tax=Sulfuriferula multivorans TaxID=1559896 RepID=A0A401J9Q4_9PROT|nr:hypothetical protein SFMTTN_0081 [Sulfuriferula multivorans]
MPINLRYRLSALFVIGVFNLLIFNRYFPLSEGWWETYGYLYNLGLKPYHDFDLAFTPLFTIINGYLLDIFGDSFFYLRLFGVAVYLLAILCLQLFLEQFFSAKASAISVIVASFLLFSEPQFIAKDYHTYQLLIVSLTLLLHSWIAGNAKLTKIQNFGGSLLLGMLVCLMIFLKQNVGVLLYAALMLSFVLQKGEWLLAKLLGLTFGVIIAVLAMLPIISFADWQNLLFSNDAKGNLVTVLGRFFIDPTNRNILKKSMLIAGMYFFFRYLFYFKSDWQKKWMNSIHVLLNKQLTQRALFATSVLLIIGIAITNSLYHLLRELIIPVSIALLIVLSFKIYRRLRDDATTSEINIKYVGIVFPLIALAYSNTNTASFDFNGMQIPIAFTVAWILNRIQRFPQQKYFLLASLFFLAILPRIAIGKLLVPYSWWENTQGSVFSARYQTNYPDLAGIYVDVKYRDVFNMIKLYVDRYSLSQSDVYFYNLPIFYALHKKIPPFREVVQWFDVVSSKQMENELRALRKHPPRVIVALEPSPVAFAVNRILKQNENLPQEDFRNQLDQWVFEGKYRLVRSVALPTHKLNISKLEIMPKATQNVLIQNVSIIGEDLDNAVQTIGALKNKVRVVEVIRNALIYQPTPSFKLKAGDMLTLRGNYQDLMAVSDELGVARDLPRDWNSVNIYLREDVNINGN